MTINRKFLPIKAHYFFFMAAMGPILPQINVYGKQLGISSVVMGSITAVLPLLFLVSKPAFGYIIDYFSSARKTIFLGLLIVLGTSYSLLYFLPEPARHQVPFSNVYNFTQASSIISSCNNTIQTKDTLCSNYRNVTCKWECNHENTVNSNISVYLEYSNNNYGIHCSNSNTSNVSCFNGAENCTCNFICEQINEVDCLYGTPTFWGFVILMAIGTIGFNVANCVSDAICFDVLGENGQLDYGKQRVWGTIGFGISALLSGYIVDVLSQGNEIKTYTPVFILVFVFIIVDIVACFKLKLPKLPTSDNILKDLGKLLKHKHIVIFLIFATLAGIVDSFIVYFLFWYLEDLAAATGYAHNIKLLEGLTVAAETLGGEVLFFSLSGKIIEKIGYGHSLTFCFVSYAIRLGAVSLIPSPWWILPIELVMQGPTYAMCYTTIVAYTSAISPPGTSATMQGIAAGMDDGFGYAIGSLIGGFLYKYSGGQRALQIFSSIALCCAIIHFILYVTILKNSAPGKSEKNYKSPEEALQSVTDPSMVK
ncbi:major facilitator superfamily domain-containing protein 6 [Chrysoperla carnea]|uniref:major facilitator superfamily domain-containing protein 6 n=1 Tax=Chrysoperla carnea TaxID=189513 RepID=UPI001D07E00D|nr:major facilitator superfamily domain-containing protein 6 [Chrysoperla carnea]XP_044737447.1 major facilitator superfamily domain-containing protein 6 [Chrysoperla carnea]XP_044737448.1 major facilitator superfamily domain-containing protein 6 [Chrysoperla carnea]XP_044737449.1 major facilitator superfamily domain-containing protein 6 [Chrysoperla carnea]XP_044737450.1 major facilitator superfamily domain-containing protein 6 [Chrysoperla carnea]